MSGNAPSLTHANRHATGAPDAVSPASIGAATTSALTAEVSRAEAAEAAITTTSIGATTTGALAAEVARAEAAETAAITTSGTNAASASKSADTITDGTAHVSMTTAERTKLASQSGTNTGDQTLSGLGGAPLASPALTGTPTAPTATALDASTKLATTAYADAAVGVEKARALAAEAAITLVSLGGTTAVAAASAAASASKSADTITNGSTNASMLLTERTKLAAITGTNTGDQTLSGLGGAPLASPALTGTPTAPTATALDNTTKIATTAYADLAVGVEKTRALAAEALKANLASPALTGTPTGVTAAALDNTTKLATTAYADLAVGVEKTRALAAEAAEITARNTAIASALLVMNPLAGCYVSIDGHSIAAGFGSTGRNFDSVTGAAIGRTLGYSNNLAGWFAKFGDLVDAGGVLNYGHNSTLAADIAALVLDGKTTGLGFGNSFYGAHIIQALTNNLVTNAGGANQTQDLLGLTHSLRSMIWTIRATGPGGACATSDAGAFAYTGTWTQATSDGVSIGGKCAHTTTNGDKVVITITTDTAVILLRGYDDTANGTAGTSYSWAVSGGGATGTGTTSNQMYHTGQQGYTQTNSTPIALVLLGTGATTGATKTVTITKTIAGGELRVSSLLSFTTGYSAPTIVLVKDAPPSGMNSTQCAPYNAVLDALVTEVGKPAEVLAFDVDALSPGNFTNGTLTVDGTHYSDRGGAVVSAGLAAVFTTLGYRKGQNAA